MNLKGSQQQTIVDPGSDANGTLALSSDEQRYCQNWGFVLVTGGRMFVQNIHMLRVYKYIEVFIKNVSPLAELWTERWLAYFLLPQLPEESLVPRRLINSPWPELIMHQLVRSVTQRSVRSRSVDSVAAFTSVAWPLSRIFFPIFSSSVNSISSVNMGKKEEEEIIRIAKKMDKMAQKKNGVREEEWMLNATWGLFNVSRSGCCVCLAKVGANGLWWS